MTVALLSGCGGKASKSLAGSEDAIVTAASKHQVESGERIASISANDAHPAPVRPAPKAAEVAVGLQAVRHDSVLRARPAQSSEILMQLPQGAAVTVVRNLKNEEGLWVYIKTQSKQGWAQSQAFATR